MFEVVPALAFCKCVTVIMKYVKYVFLQSMAIGHFQMLITLIFSDQGWPI